MRDLFRLKNEIGNRVCDSNDPQKVLQPSDHRCCGGRRYRLIKGSRQIIRRNTGHRNDDIPVQKEDPDISEDKPLCMPDDLFALARKYQRKHGTDYPHSARQGRYDLASEPVVGRIKIHPQCKCDDIHSEIQKHRYIHLTGYAAQLSVQPKVEDMNISPDELKEFFSDPDIRSGEYIKNSVIIGKIKAMIGNTHIEQINPYTLLEYFLRGIAYADTQKGLAERRKLYNQIKTAFGPVMLDAITLSP